MPKETEDRITSLNWGNNTYVINRDKWQKDLDINKIDLTATDITNDGQLFRWAHLFFPYAYADEFNKNEITSEEKEAFRQWLGDVLTEAFDTGEMTEKVLRAWKGEI